MGKSVFLLFWKEKFHHIRQSKYVRHTQIAAEWDSQREICSPALSSLPF
jgi:hypothetical protein